MRVLIVRNFYSQRAIDASLLIAAYLGSQSIEYTVLDSTQLESPFDYETLASIDMSEYVLAITLGGDGTMLATARLVGSSGVPLLGINFGRLGFLVNSVEDGIVNMVADALSGEMIRSLRMNLRIDVICEGDPDPWDEDATEEIAVEDTLLEPFDALLGVPSSDGTQRSFFALNELAINRGSNGRTIDFALNLSGFPISQLSGDGVVIATATGSTGYALSAGGPIVTPEFTGMILVPIACHTLNARPILVASHDIIALDVAQAIDSREVTLFVDGEKLVFDRKPKRVYVRRGPEPSVLLRAEDERFFRRLAQEFF